MIFIIMGIISIMVLSLLPALIYSFIIYITIPYKTINIKNGMVYLVGGFMSVILLLYFFYLFPGWNNIASVITNHKIYPLHFLHAKTFIQVGLVEELVKLITFIIIEKLLNNDKRKYHPLSTMFNVAMISLGFAVVENVSYAMKAFDPLDVILWRSVTAVIGHMVFGLFMGYWIALGRVGTRLKNRSLFDIVVLKSDKLRRRIFILIGLLSAIILHGIYDLHVFINGDRGISTLYMLLIMSLLAASWCFKNLNKSYKNKLEKSN